LLKNNAHVLCAKLVALAITQTRYIGAQQMNATRARQQHPRHQIQERALTGTGGTAQKKLFTGCDLQIIDHQKRGILFTPSVSDGLKGDCVVTSTVIHDVFHAAFNK
jgi:hypothetical protein